MQQPISLHQLRIFTYVAQQKSFSKAASLLRMSQPSVSIQIKSLEDILRVKLFDRIGRTVHLTAEGLTVLAYAKKLFDLVGNLKADLASIKGLTSGELIVGACKVGSAQILPRAIASFKQHYPAVEITLRVAQSDQVEKWILENEVDLGMIIGDPLSQKIMKQVFREEELLLVLPRRHPLTKKSAVSLEEIAKEILLFPYTGRLASLIEGVFAVKGIPITRKIALGSSEALKTAISVGLGLSIMASSSIEREAIIGAVVTRKIRNSNLRFPLNIIYHKDKHLSRIAVTFLEFLQKLSTQQAARIPFAKQA